MKTELSLIRSEITPPTFTLTESAIQQRDNLTAELSAFTRCESITDAQAITEIAGHAKAYVAGIKKQRLEITRPIDQFKGLAISLEDSATAPVIQALEKAGQLVAAWQTAENLRVRLEQEAKRREEQEAFKKAQEAAQKAQEEAARAQRIQSDASERRAALAAQEAARKAQEMRELMSSPSPEARKAAGSILKTVVRWEVTDAKLLYQQFPHFFDLVPKKAVINASVTKDTNLPGLKVWEEVEGGFRAAK